MKRYCFLLALLALMKISKGQVYEKTMNWVQQNNIELNNPKPPAGFIRSFSCDSSAVYKKRIGDTIIFYNWTHTIAETLPEFIEIYKRPEYNITKYPKKVQKNGTIIVVTLRADTFIYRNDSLYLLDEDRDYFVTQFIENMELLQKKQIDSVTFENRMKEAKLIDERDYPPKFKLIFHKKLFKKSNSILLKKDVNFKEERVELVRKWKQNGKRCYEINLHQDRDGRYIFNSDMIFLDWENCQIKK